MNDTTPPPDDALTLRGGCYCGAVRWTANGSPAHSALCHCKDCRRWSGAPVVGWIAFQEAQVHIDGETRTFASSEHGRRSFCAACGTGLFYRNAELLPGIVDIQTGTADDPASVRPSAQIMVSQRLEYMRHIDELPAFTHYPGME